MKQKLLAAIRTKFVKDTLTLQASGFLTQASGFAASAVLAFALGAHGQGLFVMAVTLQALLFNLVNVGVVQATVSQVAAASSRRYCTDRLSSPRAAAMRASGSMTSGSPGCSASTTL